MKGEIDVSFISVMKVHMTVLPPLQTGEEN